jgi:hypothetical protein
LASGANLSTIGETEFNQTAFRFRISPEHAGARHARGGHTLPAWLDHSMRIATYDVNGINGRLANWVGWLQEAAPDIVCLQELKAPDDNFPAAAIRAVGYGAVWHGQKSWNGVAILARGGEPVETRRGLPGDPDDAHSRYIEAAIGGIIVECLYLPNGNPAPGPKFDQAAVVRTADELRSKSFGQPRTGRSGWRLQRDADRSRRVCAGALGR